MNRLTFILVLFLTACSRPSSDEIYEASKPIGNKEQNITATEWVNRSADTVIESVCKKKCSGRMLKCIKEQESYSLDELSKILLEDGSRILTYKDTPHPETGESPEKAEILEFKIFEDPNRCAGKVKFLNKDGSHYEAKGSYRLG